jgi:hypothetical protein
MGQYAIVQTRMARNEKGLELTDEELAELDSLAEGLPSERVEQLKILAAEDSDAAIAQLRGEAASG